VRAIFTYHSIDDSGSPISVSPDAFRAHVRWLAASEVKVVPLARIVEHDDSADAVAITFDDGFQNFHVHAAPLLRELRMPATVFVVADHVGRDNAWKDAPASGPNVPRLALMSWDAVGQAREVGVEIGAHTRRHRDLATVRGADLEDEVAGCVERIAAEIGERPTSFAYPYGSVSDDVVTVVRDVFQRACTTELRFLSPADDVALLPRLDMFYFRDPGQLESWGSSAFRRRVWLRAQGRRVKRFMTLAGRTA
jgi:peptidoglycan/xylan/chitin deacetylase (PgdA/CDA1 family)